MSDPSSESPNNDSGVVARSTFVVVGGLASAIVVGLVKQRLISITFGTGFEIDAFTAANIFPELLFTILSGGALSFAFIPIYSKKLGEEGANRLFSQVVSLIFLLAVLTSIVGALVALPLVQAKWGIAPSFSLESQLLTVKVMRILLFSTIIFAVSSIISGTLHAHQHFLLPALAPSMYSLGIILGILLLSDRLGIFGLAWGAVFGSMLHLAIQIPGLISHGVRWKPLISFTDPALRRVAILMAPRVIDLFMARLSIGWINTNLASAMDEGRVAALGYAYQLMNMPWTLIGTAIGIAVFPTMAALAAKKDIEAQRRALSGSIRAILTLVLPAAVGLIALGQPTIRLLFEGGEFTAESTQLVYYALRFYTLALITQSLLEVVVRSFAAQQDTLTPLIVSFFTTALNIGLAIWLSRPIWDGGFEHGGLALANGVAVGIESLIGLTILHIRWRGVDARRILIDAGKALIASTVMAITLWAFLTQLSPGLLVSLIGGGLLGGSVYIVTALLLGIEEMRTIPLAMIRHFIKPDAE